MVLSKSELIERIGNEVRILLHLASKIEPGMLEYRPGPGQRSLRELVEYLSLFAPIHLRTVCAEAFDMEVFVAEWQTEEAVARKRNLDELKAAISGQAAIAANLIDPLSEDELRAEIELFGHRASRGAMLVWMLLSHYAAYRMQLFLYLKACGRTELSTMNVWGGADGRPPAL